MYTAQVAQLLGELLVHPHGVAYIASKRYYFGVGGGTSEFIDILNTITSSTTGVNVPLWKVEIVEVLEDKFSNIREIVKIVYN